MHPSLEYVGVRQELSYGYAPAGSPLGPENEYRPYEWYEVTRRGGQGAIAERLSDGRASVVHSTLLRLSRDDIIE